MKFGPFMLWQVPAGQRPEQVITRETELLAKAEEWGYDTAYIAEHHFCNYSPAGAPGVALAYLAGRTKRIKLGTAVSVLPLHHPLTLAEEWATVDVYSGGRLELGVGRGYNWFEFNSMGIDLLENTARFVECLEVLRKAWTEERVNYEGRFYSVFDTEVIPKPIQKPHPHMWYASIRKESAAMCGNLGLGYCSVFSANPEQLVERRRIWTEAARDAGYSDEWMETTVQNTPTQRIVWVAETDKQAEQELRGMIKSFTGLAELCAFPGTIYPGRKLPLDRVQYPEVLKQGWLQAEYDYEFDAL
ncbi:MAG: LLM class flavin-dependent oxidoreductase, partial [Dehalococcoidia bacterium]